MWRQMLEASYMQVPQTKFLQKCELLMWIKSEELRKIQIKPWFYAIWYHFYNLKKWYRIIYLKRMPNRYSLALFTFSLISQVIVIPCAKYRSFTLFFRAEVLWKLCGNCAYQTAQCITCNNQNDRLEDTIKSKFMFIKW